MAKKVCLNTNSDRISALHEPLKYHIISFLNTKEAIRTSVLSSSWREVWKGLTRIELDGSHIGLPMCLINTKTPIVDSINKSLADFYEFGYRVLSSITMLDELKLCVPVPLVFLPGFEEEVEMHLLKWLNYAVGLNVKKLDLELNDQIEHIFCLPKNVSSCKSITNLRLSECKVNVSCLTNKDLLPSLRELWLRRVNFDGTVLESEGLLANCINLESFICIECTGLSKLKLLGLPKLKSVVALLYKGYNESDNSRAIIEIDAPNLVEFSYEFKGYHSELCQIEVSRCKKMKILELRDLPFTDDKLFTILEAFPVLENLMIDGCNRLKSVVIPNQQLRSLTFVCCNKLLEVNIEATNLQDISAIGNYNMPVVTKKSSSNTKQELLLDFDSFK